MHGTVDAGRRGAAGQQLFEEEARLPLGMGGIGGFLLLHEGVAVEPVDQLRAIGGDDLRLRQMQMRVDEARHDQVRPVIDDLGAVRKLRKQRGGGARRQDEPVADQQQPVLEVAVRRAARCFGIIDKPEQTAAQSRDRCVFSHWLRLRPKISSYLHQIKASGQAANMPNLQA